MTKTALISGYGAASEVQDERRRALQDDASRSESEWLRLGRSYGWESTRRDESLAVEEANASSDVMSRAPGESARKSESGERDAITS